MSRRAKSARETKFASQSAKRRKMAQDLEKREAAHESERQQERAARDKLQVRLKPWSGQQLMQPPACTAQRHYNEHIPLRL